MAEMGVHSVAYAFPRVKIITTAVDKKVNDLFRIIPGIGEYLEWTWDFFSASGPLPRGAEAQVVSSGSGLPLFHPRTHCLSCCHVAVARSESCQAAKPWQKEPFHVPRASSSPRWRS